MHRLSSAGGRQVARWRSYHSGLGVYGHRPQTSVDAEAPSELIARRNENCRAQRLVDAYRTYGHLLASIDNVDYRNTPKVVKELDLNRYGLSPQDHVDLGLVYGSSGREPASALVKQLEEIYCGKISYEFSYLESEAEREWFASRVESTPATVEPARKLQIAEELLRAQVWEKFLATKFPAVKRYSGEGCESIQTFFTTMFQHTLQDTIEYVTVLMAHRGKLAVLSGLLQVPAVKLFHKISGNPEFPPEVNAMCDTVMHFNASADITGNGRTVRYSLLHNPSHLEAGNPVAMGKARSKQMQLKSGDYSTETDARNGERVLNLQIHGDAAFTGQGINQECLMLSRAPHFDIGGSIHCIINNQVGFTLPSHRSRSSRYVTDLAKSIAAPVIHVNADYPELVQRATSIAYEYRKQFRKDVFIDLNCYRRWGHNEVDDPTFTNPGLYQLIRSRKSIPDLYIEKLISEGVIDQANADKISNDYQAHLQSQLEAVPNYKPEADYFREQWSGFTLAPPAVETWHTGTDVNLLKMVALKSVDTPEGFKVHPHLEKTHIKNRISRITSQKDIDWSTAETMAFGSLLMEGRCVRISGEDVGRGTFSHRHAMLVDQTTEHIHIPLNYLHEHQEGFLEVANSILSEEAVLAYEYGMAYDNPNNLFVWEAQFGDFYNGAQIIVDTYITSAETKWLRSNGLVMLLPHGYDGTAADHSSARPERFLQLVDSSETRPDSENVCMNIVNPTTPAQYFHLLRRQVARNYRKPLLVIAPKILLRSSEALSPLQDFAPGTHFHPVLGDPIAEANKVKRVYLVSGKHYYELNKERIRAKLEDVALVRLESLTPFPLWDLQAELDKYKNARQWVWAQEEHRNMGAWSFVKPRFENLLGRRIQYAGRKEAPCSAVGSGALHRAEVEQIIKDAFYK